MANAAIALARLFFTRQSRRLARWPRRRAFIFEPIEARVLLSADVLDPVSLQPLLDAAMTRLSVAGLSAEQLRTAAAVRVAVDDLPGWTLGSADRDGVVLDRDAAGYGWFVDSTPADDSEFVRDGDVLRARETGGAQGRLDALTVLTHELGHYLGRGHADSSDPGDTLMDATLRPGVRRIVDARALSVGVGLTGGAEVSHITLAPTISWVSDTSGFWDDPANWRDAGGASRVPNGADDVLIDRGAANPTVTIRAGSQAVRELLTNESLAIVNAFLAIASEAEINDAFTLDGGVLDAGGPLAMTGATTWTGGQINAGVAGVTNTGSIALTGSLSKVLTGVLNNRGTITHGGSASLDIAASGLNGTLNNLSGGVYEIRGDAFVARGLGGNASAFNNAGTVRKSAGAGTATTRFGVAFNNVGGTIDVRTGTLAIAGTSDVTPPTHTGGTFTAAAGAELDFDSPSGTSQVVTGRYGGSGAGVVRLKGTLVVGAAGATFEFSGPLVEWVGGTLDGGAAGLTNVGTLTLAGADLKRLAGNLVNAGTIIQTGDLFPGTHGILTNLPGAAYDFRSDGAIAIDTVINRGVLSKSAGSGTSFVSPSNFSNQGGALEVGSGTMQIGGPSSGTTRGGVSTGGVFTVAAGAALNLTSPGNTATYEGTYTGSGAGAVRVAAGVLRAGAAGATFDLPAGLFQWTGGTLGGGSSGLTNSGTLTLAGANPKFLSGVFNNIGTVVHTGTGDLQLDSSDDFRLPEGIFNNLASGVYQLQGDQNFTRNFAGTVSSFNNAGVLRKTGGTGTSANLFNTPFNNLGGTIEVHSGTFALTGDSGSGHAPTHTGGSFVVDAGALLSLSSGPFSLTQTLTGTYTGVGEGTVRISGGTLLVGSGGATFSIPRLEWIGGIVDARNGGPLTNTGHILLTGGGAVANIIRGTLNNAGTFIERDALLVVAGDLGLGNFTNLPGAVYEIQGSSLGFFERFSTGAVFTNRGLLRKASIGQTDIALARFSNEGTLEVATGTLAIRSVVAQATGTSLTGGTWRVLDGATLTFTNHPSFASNAGTIVLDGPGSDFPAIAGLTTNSGSFSILNGRQFTTADGLTNTGAITVGAGSVLNVSGAYTQGPTATFTTQLGGNPASQRFGRLVATGQVSLDGGFGVTLVDGFGPVTGQTFTVMTYPSGTGTFSRLSGTSAGRSSLFAVQVSGTAVVLDAVGTSANLAFEAFDAAVFPMSATPGEPINVAYSVRNLSGIAASGDWYDSVYLSRESLLDPGDTLLGRVLHRGGVPEGSTYREVLSATVPALVDGAYHVIVLADSRGLAPDADRSNNTGVSAATVAVSVPLISLGVPVNATIVAGQERYYRLVLPPRSDVKLSAGFGSPTQGELFVRYRELPDRTTFDDASVPGEINPRLLLASPQGGVYYVLVRGRDGAGAGSTFTLLAETAGFEIVRITPLSGSKRTQSVVDVFGSQFTPATTLTLANDAGDSRVGQDVRFFDSNHLRATFDLVGLPLGVYRVTARDGDRTTTALDSFTVTDISSGLLSFAILSPATVHIGAQIPVTININNGHDAPAVAPILEVMATGVADGQEHRTAMGDGDDVLPGVLPPLFNGSVGLVYSPKPVGAGASSSFGLSLLNPTVTGVDWDALRASMRPESIAVDAWAAIWENLRPELGATLANLYALLQRDSRELDIVGVHTLSISRLFNFEIRRANDLPAIPVPSAAVDAAFAAPGLPLVFGREFGSSIADRYRLGRLGRGWVDSLDISADSDATTGLVRIQQGSIVRVFARKPDGSYEGVRGDRGVLTLDNGALRLREATGEAFAFLTDGRLDYIEDLNRNRLTATYTGNQLTRITHSNGDFLTLAYNAQGRISQVTDPTGRIGTYVYDASGEHLLSVTTAAGTLAYTYTPETSGPRAHAIASITYPDATHLFFEYDSRGRLARQQGDGGAERLTFSYDVARYRVTDALGNLTDFFYDDTGRIKGTVDGLGRVTTFAYDGDNHLVGVRVPGGAQTTFTYDADGLPASTIDPLGHDNEFGYEPTFGRMVGWLDALDHSTTFAYDSHGNAVSTTFAGGATEEFEYDGNGNLTRSVNRAGHTIRYTYDAHGLLTHKDLPDAPDVDYRYDAHGNLISATDGGGTTTMEYDAGDRLTTITYPSGRVLRFAYDDGGRRIETRDQDGFVVHYRYDDVGRLAELTDTSGQRIVAYDYDGVGRLGRETRGNGTVTTYEYDAAGQLLHLVHLAADGAIQARFDYTYDDLGRRTSVSTLEGVTEYAYDAANRLTGAVLPDGRVITYAYDAAGNRTVVDDSGVVTDFTINELNQYVQIGATSQRFDADGNLVSATGPSGARSYAYDAGGRLHSVVTPDGVSTYEYDVFGNRIATVHNGQRTEYLIDPAGLGNVVAEYDGAGGLRAHYVQGLGLVSRVDGAGPTAYFEFDGAGNTAQLTGANGAVLNRYVYLPFGESLSSSETVANPFRFAGQFGVMRDGNGLDYMRNRWYDAAQGRFTQRDPIGLAGGPNLYAYVANDPVDLVDPSGLVMPPYPVGTSYEALEAALAWWRTYEALALQSPPFGSLPPGSPAPTPASVWSPSIPSNPLARSILPNGTTYAEANAAFRAALARQAAVAAVRGAARVGLYAAIATGAIIIGYELAYLNYFRETGDTPECSAALMDLGLENVFQPYCHHPPTPGLVPAGGSNTTQTNQLDPRDPNDIAGPDGFGPEEWLRPEGLFPYVINFENAPDASAPAQDIYITERLDADLDLDTFELGDFGFGNLVVDVPSGRQFYHTRLDLTELTGPARQNLFVDVTAELDRATRTVRWTVLALDPATLDLPIDLRVGFLPPDVHPPEGRGFVTYFVRPRADLATRTQIDAHAEIVFGVNEPVLTNTYVNTIDSGDPASAVAPLSAASPSDFTVSWAGLDDASGPAGSGIRAFDVFVSRDGGSFSPFLVDTVQTSAVFHGEVGHTYAFFSVAADNVGLREADPATADATTTVYATPLAMDDSATTDEDVTVVVDVLDNDSDADGALDTETVTITSSPAHGVATVEADGRVRYIGATDFFGTDAFTYTVADSQGLLSNAATVRLTIRPVNDPVTLAPISDQTVVLTHHISLDIDAADPSDPDQMLTFTLRDGAPTGAAIDPATGVFTWTPTLPLQPAVYPITVRVTDSGTPVSFAEQTFVVTVLPNLDVDGDGTADTTDGQLIVRYLAGSPDSQLLSGVTLGSGATRTTGAAIRNYLDAGKTLRPEMLDADGNGQFGALTDGRLMTRYLSGVGGAALVNGSVIGAGATRTTAPAIVAYLGGFRPALAPPAPPTMTVASAPLLVPEIIANAAPQLDASTGAGTRNLVPTAAEPAAVTSADVIDWSRRWLAPRNAADERKLNGWLKPLLIDVREDDANVSLRVVIDSAAALDRQFRERPLEDAVVS